MSPILKPSNHLIKTTQRPTQSQPRSPSLTKMVTTSCSPHRRVRVASADDPFNKWQTHIVLDGQEVTPALGQATATDQTPLYVDKYGNILPEDGLPTAVRNNAVFEIHLG